MWKKTAWMARRASGNVGAVVEPGAEGAAWGSAFWRVEDLAHSVVGTPGVVPMGLGGVLEAPLEAHDGDGEVGQAGEVARQVAGSHPAAVFVVGHVAHVVNSIFD